MGSRSVKPLRNYGVVNPAPNAVERWQMKRKIDVRANVRGRDLGSVVKDVRASLAKVAFPSEYHPELLGEYAERESAQDASPRATALSCRTTCERA